MRKAPISLQDLRRRIYAKAKSDTSWRFWGLYVHICKMETLRAAYALAKANDGAPGIDGETFEAIERRGVERFLEQLRDELVSRTYRPMRNRRREIPKPGRPGKVRVLGIPAIRDRVVQGAVKLILEPIFEADFQPGSFGYRPRRTAHQAVARVAQAIVQGKTRAFDLDLRAFFDTVRHDLLLAKVARRVQDGEVLHLLKLILKASGRRGVPQGGVASPLLANIYLNEVDRMLERAQEVTRVGPWAVMTYARYADDLVVLITSHPRQDWLVGAVDKRLGEEFAKLGIEVNREKSRVVDLTRGESFGFLGFEFRRVRSLAGKWRPQYTPKRAKQTEVLRKVKEILRSHRHLPVREVIPVINPVVAGWVNYFRVGHSGRCFQRVRCEIEKKVRRFMARQRGRKGFGWTRWSTGLLYGEMGLYHDYRIRYLTAPKASPA